MKPIPVVSPNTIPEPLSCFVASSWRNKDHRRVVDELRGRGIAVYDYRDPPEREALRDLELDTAEGSERATYAARANLRAILEADFMLVLLPSGNATHFEAGYAYMNGSPVFLYDPYHRIGDCYHAILPAVDDVGRAAFATLVRQWHEIHSPKRQFPPEVTS